MQSTVRNFWKIIYERNCAIVVMTSGLIEGGEEENTHWPDSGIVHYGELILLLTYWEKRNWRDFRLEILASWIP